MTPSTLTAIALWGCYFTALVMIMLATRGNSKRINHLKAQLKNTRANQRWIESELIEHIMDDHKHPEADYQI